MQNADIAKAFFDYYLNLPISFQFSVDEEVIFHIALLSAIITMIPQPASSDN